MMHALMAKLAAMEEQRMRDMKDLNKRVEQIDAHHAELQRALQKRERPSPSEEEEQRPPLRGKKGSEQQQQREEQQQRPQAPPPLAPLSFPKRGRPHDALLWDFEWQRSSRLWDDILSRTRLLARSGYDANEGDA
jgi:hypothetical protein